MARKYWAALVVYKWEKGNSSRNDPLHPPLEVEIRPRGEGCGLILRAFLAKRGPFLKILNIIDSEIWSPTSNLLNLFHKRKVDINDNKNKIHSVDSVRVD